MDMGNYAVGMDSLQLSRNEQIKLDIIKVYVVKVVLLCDIEYFLNINKLVWRHVNTLIDYALISQNTLCNKKMNISLLYRNCKYFC